MRASLDAMPGQLRPVVVGLSADKIAVLNDLLSVDYEDDVGVYVFSGEKSFAKREAFRSLVERGYVEVYEAAWESSVLAGPGVVERERALTLLREGRMWGSGDELADARADHLRLLTTAAGRRAFRFAKLLARWRLGVSRWT